jgi:LPXTG-motif cell wall-anchored protein
LAALGVMVGTTPAGAAVEPAGDVTVTFTQATLQAVVNGVPESIGPFKGTLNGTVDGQGNLQFPQAGISFDLLDTTVVVAAQIQLEATGAWTGTVDPEGKTVSLTGPFRTLVTISSLGFDNCQVGPSTFQASGNNYANGKVTVKDASFPIAEIPPGTPGCLGLESVINTALNLPGNGGITLPLTFSPVLTGTGRPPPPTTTTVTVATTTTTTAAPPPPDTPPPTVGPTALPRTGPSSELVLAGLGLSLVCGGLLLVARGRPRRTVPQ